MILRFVLGGWQVAKRFHQALRVVPADPFQRRILDVFEAAPRAGMMDDLRLEQADDRLCQRVVVRIATTADRGFDARLGQSLGVANA